MTRNEDKKSIRALINRDKTNLKWVNALIFVYDFHYLYQ